MDLNKGKSSREGPSERTREVPPIDTGLLVPRVRHREYRPRDKSRRFVAEQGSSSTTNRNPRQTRKPYLGGRFGVPAIANVFPESDSRESCGSGNQSSSDRQLIEQLLMKPIESAIAQNYDRVAWLR